HHQRQRETPDGHAFKSTTGGVRPNPRENGQISPSTTVRASRGAGNRRHLASVLRQGRKTRILTPVWESSGESRLMVTNGWHTTIHEFVVINLAAKANVR